MFPGRKTMYSNVHFIYELNHKNHVTNLYLASHKRDIGKQPRFRSDAAECSVWSGSALFAWSTGISVKRVPRHSLYWKWTVQKVEVGVSSQHKCVNRQRTDSRSTITKTRLCNFDPLKPHFCIVKLGFTGVYIIFLISAQKHRLWVLLRIASPRRF